MMASYVYNKEYYHSGCGTIPYEEPEHWVQFFGVIAQKIVDDFAPKTVLDAGCAMGYLVAALRDLGVEAYGIDISSYALSKVREDVKQYCFEGSLTEPLPEQMPQKYDLVFNCEILEHLYAEDGEKAIQNLCQWTDTIIFSSTPDDFQERTHLNVQQREYWAALFAKNGFLDDLSYRPTYLTYHAVCYHRRDNILRQIQDYERNIARTEAEYRQEIDRWSEALQDHKNHLAEAQTIIASKNVECEQLRQENTVNLVQKQSEIEQLIHSHADELAQKQAQIEQLKHSYSEQMDKLEAEHSRRILQIRETCEQEKTESIEKIKTDHQQEIKQINQEHQICIDEIDVELKNIESEIIQLKVTHENEKNALQVAFESETNTLRADMENEKQTLLAQRDEELNKLLQMHRNVCSEKQTLEYHLSRFQEINNALLHSTSWKITKPIRKTKDIMRSAVYSHESLRLLYKGIQSVHREGVASTWAKISTRRQTIRKAKQEAKETSRLLTSVKETVKFSILVPLYNTPEAFLREMINSVRQQSYSNWELCLADGSDTQHVYVKQVCHEYTLRDKRIKYKKLKKNLGIAENTNACANMATGDYIALLDHDDFLTQDALAANCLAIQETGADVLYSDEDHYSVQHAYVNPFFKPDWSPDLLYGQMYICHMLVFQKQLFDSVGRFSSKYNGAQDYDMMLRLSEKAKRIHHIPRILYHWRDSENSTAMNANSKPYAHDAGRNALDAHLQRKYNGHAYAEDGKYLFTYCARFKWDTQPLISIIIPMKDKSEMTNACVESILAKSTFHNFEILILDNRSEEEETFAWFKTIEARDQRIKVIPADMEFNWSKLNNWGIRHARGDVYVFLNNDTLIITSDWLERLSENALREDIGAVGGQLLYEDQTIQHAGVVVGFGGWADHVFKGIPPVHSISPFVSPALSRDVLAVTGACMAISKKTIEKIGSFDESFVICGSDVELCIRAHEKGLFNLYNADVQLYHLESKSRDSFIPQIDFERSYATYTPYREHGDPFYNSNLDMNSVIPKVRN